MTDPIVRIEGLCHRFRGASVVLSDLTFSARCGKITALAGPDGAGKTTLLRIIAGLLVPVSGKVLVRGLDPAKDAAALREQIGYMPQKFGLYEDLTVMENLQLHAELRGVLGRQRDEAFERVLSMSGLGPFTRRLAGRLSGGMKQKLGLSCALLGRPELLLLDEPGVGVDPISRRELWRTAKQLAGEGLSIIWSTAYLEEAELCDEVLLLHEGRALYSGPPAELTNRIKERCVLVKHTSGNRRAVLAQALRRPEVMDGTIHGNHIRLLLRDGYDGEVGAEAMARAGARVQSATPRFEDAFIDLVGGASGAESPVAQLMPIVPGSGGPVVEAIELTKRFGQFVAADRVSFSVRSGEVFGLLGPNGAGKSTTFRMLCGLLTPSAGTARVMGIDLQHSPGAARQRLGYMAQKFSLYGNLSVRQNLEFFSGVYGLRNAARRNAVAGMIDGFKLGPMLTESADALPLGFKQRLALACALMHKPDILFLDEPTSGVDPVTRREFWGHINGLVERGVTVVVTTHFMEEAEYCDRIALVSQGKVIAHGTPDELKREASGEAAALDTMEDTFVTLVQRASNAAVEAAA